MGILYTFVINQLPMQAFKNLQIYDPDSNRSNLLAFLDTLRSEQANEWLFLEKESRDYANNIFKEYREVAVFGSPIICKRKATVWLILAGREVRITNIVPIGTGSLSYDEYNAIFDRFYDQMVLPAAKVVGVDAHSTAPQLHIGEIIGNETYEKLIIWEITSNSASGNEHSLDFERWADFLTTAFTLKSKITAQLLERWLLEDKGWVDLDVVQRLGSDFEYGIDLLNYYVNNK
jgi:hypothetical protein